MSIDKTYKQSYELFFRQLLKNKEAGYFDEAALPSYTHSNKLMSYLFWKRIEKATAMAGNISKASVLDFGCGGGVLFKYFKSHECIIAGCDNEHCSLAQKTCDEFDINSTLYQDLLEINDHYDSIFALDVLEHVDDLEKYLNKLKSVLKDNGKLVLSGPTENFLYKAGRKFAGFSGHYHVRNIYQIEDMLIKLGMHRIRTKTLYPFIPLFRISLWQKKNSSLA